MKELDQGVTDLLLARRRLQALKDAYAAKRLEFEAATQSLADEIRDCADEVRITEAWLRDLAVKQYQASNNKHPHPYIGIRVMTTLEYDEVAAFSWATEHGLALRLDKAAFERIAKTTPLEFVALKSFPTATIAQGADQKKEVREK